jgi:hypothetical protein
MIDEDYGWGEICAELGLDKPPGGEPVVRLAQLDEQDRAALMAEARKQIKREFGLA